MKRINKVAVLGAGTMGARIAAHFANAGVPSLLLDIVPPDADGPARNKIAAAGLEATKKSKPAAFFEPSLARLVTIGNFEDDLKRLGDVDWIIEAFPQAPAQVVRSAAEDSPVFIVGLPRSGTTLVERILGSHSSVTSKPYFLLISARGTLLNVHIPSSASAVKLSVWRLKSASIRAHKTFLNFIVYLEKTWSNRRRS